MYNVELRLLLNLEDPLILQTLIWQRLDCLFAAYVSYILERKGRKHGRQSSGSTEIT